MEQMIKMQHQKTLIFLLVFLTALPFTGDAGENCKWKEVKGVALAYNITVEEAEKRALDMARLSAIEEVTGLHIDSIRILLERNSSSDQKKESALVDFIMTLSEGLIVQEEIIKWEAEFQPLDKDKPPIPRYRVYARCCVSERDPNSQRDPYFTVSVETNKPVFFSGDLAKLTITTTGRDAYITVFHLSSEDKVKVLLPNEYQKKTCIREGEKFIFPSHNGIYDGIKVQAAPHHKSDVDYFIIVATKEWFDFKGQLKKDKDIPITSFNKVLVSIPAKERAMAITGYEIRERD